MKLAEQLGESPALKTAWDALQSDLDGLCGLPLQEVWPRYYNATQRGDWATASVWGRGLLELDLWWSLSTLPHVPNDVVLHVGLRNARKIQGTESNKGPLELLAEEFGGWVLEGGGKAVIPFDISRYWAWNRDPHNAGLELSEHSNWTLEEVSKQLINAHEDEFERAHYRRVYLGFRFFSHVIHSPCWHWVPHEGDWGNLSMCHRALLLTLVPASVCNLAARLNPDCTDACARLLANRSLFYMAYAFFGETEPLP